MIPLSKRIRVMGVGGSGNNPALYARRKFLVCVPQNDNRSEHVAVVLVVARRLSECDLDEGYLKGRLFAPRP